MYTLCVLGGINLNGSRSKGIVVLFKLRFEILDRITCTGTTLSEMIML